MITTSMDSAKKQTLLDEAVNLLKIMVQYHIDAAKRSRYARAAYYCTVIKDIYYYLNDENNFNQYYKQIILENNTRPALKDEMKKAIQIKISK